MTRPAAQRLKGTAFLRFLAVMAAGNLIWEFAHVPLYTLWLTGSPGEIIYAVLHCTVGDVMIAAITLVAAVTLFGRGGWSAQNFGRVAAAMILFALTYTVFSEWLNTVVRQSWTYRPLMPVLPPFGTGLTPVLQWIVVPLLAFFWMRHRSRGEG